MSRLLLYIDSGIVSMCPFIKDNGSLGHGCGNIKLFEKGVV